LIEVYAADVVTTIVNVTDALHVAASAASNISHEEGKKKSKYCKPTNGKQRWSYCK
jgi:hypothetical protein